MIAYRPDDWSGDLVRELLTVVYGGHRADTGHWIPDAAAVGRYRRVSTSTVRHWTRRAQPPAIPEAQIRRILQRRRPTTHTLHREQLATDFIGRVRQRAALGRGRGNLTEYAARGWLDQHLVLVIAERDRPLQKVVVIRDGRETRQRAVRGHDVLDVAVAENRFAGDQARYDLLASVTQWRLQLPVTKVATGHTQVWLAGAPRPQLPVAVNLLNDDSP